MILADLRRHGPLLRNMTRREARQRYKGSVLGLGWNLVIPAVLVATYTFVFKYVFRSAVPHYAVYLVTGLGAWTMFATGCQVASTSIVGNASLVKKVRFPREIVPLSAMAANWVTAGAMLLIALALCIFVAPGVGLPLVVLPVFLLLLAIFTTGLGLALSALNVYLRDVEFLFSAILTPWFFMTPILFSFEDLPARIVHHVWLLRLLHYGNPVTPFVFGVQDAMFFSRWPNPADVVYAVVAAAVSLAGGLAIFRRLERDLAVEL